MKLGTTRAFTESPCLSEVESFGELVQLTSHHRSHLTHASLSFSRRLRRRGEKLVLQPARPPFLLASDGLVGLGCEGNVWFSARLCRLGPSRCRVWCPGGACKVEAAQPQWNKVLQALFHLVVTCSGVGDKPVGWELFRSGDRVGASDLDGSCTGVPTGARTC